MARSSHSAAHRYVIENSPSLFIHDTVIAKALDALSRNRDSQKKFAIELHVHPSQISMWLSGARPLEESDAKAVLVVAEVLALEDARASTQLAYEIRCFLTGRKP